MSLKPDPNIFLECKVRFDFEGKNYPRRNREA